MIVEETLGEIQTWDRIFYSTISDIARSRFGRTPSVAKSSAPAKDAGERGKRVQSRMEALGGRQVSGWLTIPLFPLSWTSSLNAPPRDFSVKECTLIEHYSPVTTDYKESDKRLHGQYERLPYLA